MKINNLILLVPFFVLLPNLSQPATAACVDTDVSLQLAIYDRTQSEPNQNNEVSSYLDNNCFNNTNTTINSQVYVGEGTVNQDRKRTTRMSSPNNPLEGMVDMPNITTHTNHQIVVPVPFYLVP